MKQFQLFILILIALLNAGLYAVEQVYQNQDEYIAQQFEHSSFEKAHIWLTPDHKEYLTELLGHKPYKIRVPVWHDNDTSVWILEEIGKEQPITVGVVVKGKQIQDIKVLVYRESRGHEVRQSFFTAQYVGAKLESSGKLSQPIDGITGATLSVRALNKVAAMALYLSQFIEPK